MEARPVFVDIPHPEWVWPKGENQSIPSQHCRSYLLFTLMGIPDDDAGPRRWGSEAGLAVSPHPARC
jgi:hypothetical protein